MLINEYLQMRNASLTAGSVNHDGTAQPANNTEQTSAADSPFAQTLREKLSEETAKTSVEFSRHAMKRINERDIRLDEDDRLTRLNKAVEIAQSKGSNDTLVILGDSAFIVSVRNNTVITTMNAEDMQGNIFTNIDSTVIM